MAQKRAGKLYIGTSGWMYKDWGKTFYPKDMKKGFLTFLATEFDTVEVNSSFYHLPLASTFKKWCEETPKGFVLAVKMSRYITHVLQLRSASGPLNRFLSRAKHLASKLGPVLVQLPPFLKYDDAVLRSFLKNIKSAAKKQKMRVRWALEPRNSSWMLKENASAIRELLKKEKNVSLVFPHSSKIPSFEPTAENIVSDFVYVRFHGPSEFAASRYGARRLAPWARRIGAWRAKVLDVFAYFNNDVHGHAVHDARTLKKLLGS